MVLVCCLLKKAESKVQRRYYWTFLPKWEALARSVDYVNAPEGSSEENLSWHRRIFISRRRKRWSTRSSPKEIVNFVFNKSTQETRNILLSKLVLQKKTSRKRANAKNWLQKELWYKIPKNGILSLTKVKLIVGVWRHCFEQVINFFYILLPFLISFFLFLNIVVTWMYVILVTLNSIFSTSIGKNMQDRFSLKINYFVGTACFVFKKYGHSSLSGGESKHSHSPFFISFIFYTFLSLLCQAWQLQLDFLSKTEIKSAR